MQHALLSMGLNRLIMCQVVSTSLHIWVWYTLSCHNTLSGRYKTRKGTERNGTEPEVIFSHAAAPAKMRPSEFIHMEGNFVTRDFTNERENASEGVEQAVTIQYNTAWVRMIPQPKQFCYRMWTLDVLNSTGTVETLTISSLASRARTHRSVLSAWWSPQSQYHFHCFRRRLPRLVPYSYKSATSGEKFLLL